MTEYKSQIKAISAPIENVYSKLSNLENLSTIIERLPEAEKEKFNIEVISVDELALDVQGAGKISFRIVEREENKTIKFEAQSSPIPLIMWIQLIEPNAGETRLRLTVHTKLNFIIKKMIGSKLEQGIDQIATMMTFIPYH